MTLLLPNSVFLHIPKTGGTWVRQALEDADLSIATILSRDRGESYNNTIDSWHNVPTWDIRYQERPNRFCFVRHPADWYRSYWAFRMWRKNWNIVENDFDFLCSAGTFEEFIEKVLHNYSGYLTQMYAYFTDHCTFIGKSENLPSNLLIALDLFEEKWSQARIDAVDSQVFDRHPIESLRPCEARERYLDVEDGTRIRHYREDGAIAVGYLIAETYRVYNLAQSDLPCCCR